MTATWGETKEKVRTLLSQGHTPREIALRLDISTQRVYVLMRELRDEGEQKKTTV